LQNLIHKLEVAGGIRYLRYVAALLAVAVMVLIYDWRVAKNMSTQEAMDAAQLARNISGGDGYTTLFIRPFSMFLLSQKAQEKQGAPENGKQADFSRLKRGHPDISNPPVYPVVLAGLMKILPFNYAVERTKPFWNTSGVPWRHQPDFLIIWFNQFLFFIVIVLVFLWARRLFDASVARTSAILLFGSELLWRFSASGLSTMLLLLILTGMIWFLTLLESETWDPRMGAAGMYALAALIGLFAGLGGLTRYGFAWIIVPTVGCVLLFGGPRRVGLSVTILVVFLALMVPWMIRNFNLSGAPLGTASYSLMEGTSLFPENRLLRSLSPDAHFLFRPMWGKLLGNLRQILATDIFTVSGIVTAFFLVGLLVGFRNPTIRHLRYFLVSSLGVMLVVQALARTQLSVEAPEINSENFLVLFLPMVIVYGVSLFYILLDQINLPIRELRHGVVVLFGLLACSPMIFTLLASRGSPLAYPPYMPTATRQFSEWLRKDELMMSDVPWAAAWYGNRQCVWLTLNALPDPSTPNSRENFFAINDFEKPINGLYLTQKTLDGRFQSEMIRPANFGWGTLVLSIILNKGNVPAPFPLRENGSEFVPEQQMFLTDWKRWQKER
jgi:hypothetical protein